MARRARAAPERAAPAAPRPAAPSGAAGTAGTAGISNTATGGISGTATGGISGTATGGTSGIAGTAGIGGPVKYTLTVQNYLNWCDVTENGTKYAASVPPAMSFAPGTVVNLNAIPNFIFVWGYWTGTDGDTSATHDMNMTTTVTMTSDKTILA